MIRNQTKSLTLADVWLSHTDKRYEKHWLKKIDGLVNWNKFRYRLNKLYSEDKGRPGWDPMLLMKCLLLAEWYGLSDEDLEESVSYRIDFRKFVGLNWEDEAPDSTTYCVFRKRIKKIMPRLLSILNQQLESAGYEVKKAVAVDATLVEAHSKPRGNKPVCDEEASWRGFPSKTSVDKDGNKVMARRPALYGYKINLSATVSLGFVNKVNVCKASEHETHHFFELLDKKTRAAYADKGYIGNKKTLAKGPIQDFIQFKGSPSKPITPCQRIFNKSVVPSRRIVEGVFGCWKQWYGWYKTRLIGLDKNQAAANLTAIAWNMKRWQKLCTA